MARPSKFLFDTSLADADPALSDLVAREAERQDEKLILIASESLCPRPVREALVSPYSAIYAEGYPSTRMMTWERERVGDQDRHLAFNRRYSDRRYYKGCEYTNFVEVLAQKRAAEAFAANGVRSDDIFVNVQPLSGSAANNAIYTAFAQPGDLIMGMALPHGGHLTHGSHLNRSGKFYRVLSYLVDGKTGRLDYDAIRDAAREHRPRLLIAGASAYPWELDWQALREAADAVPGRRCLLFADVSHPAGLIAAGEFPSPVGYADVISLTTHKTLCGPRGAIIMTTDRELAAQIDLGVFPGEQGGPHVNQIAAKAVAFGLAQTETFRVLMGRVRANAQTLCRSFIERGLRIQGGGTDCHLLLLDLKGTRKDSGVPLYGDIAANLLDLCDITANKNTIIGDESAAHPTGIRIGTTVVSQQGFGPEHMPALAGLIARVVEETRTFSVTTPGGQRGRARIPLDVMEEVQAGVRALWTDVAPQPEPRESGGSPAVAQGTTAIEVRGERAGVMLQGVVTSDILCLATGDARRTLLLDESGGVLADAEVQRAQDRGDDLVYHVVTSAESGGRVEAWLRGLSDGYLLFDADLTRKIDGPVAVRRVAGVTPRSQRALEAIPARGSRPTARERMEADGDLFDLQKPWFIGRHVLDEGRVMVPAGPPYAGDAPPAEALRRTALNETHRSLTQGHNMVPFAGWDMPVLYTSILDEHRAVRRAGGLFDLSHMGTMEVSGNGATRFLDLLTTNYVWRLRPGQSQYAYILKPDGRVMDDLLIYMLGKERFLVVANASNADEVLAWFRRCAAGEARLSNERPDLRADAHPRVRSLKDREESGDSMRVDLGLQGPRSQELLLRLADADPAAGDTIAALQKGEQAEVTIGPFPLIVSRTGYTGEDVGFEVFVHPDQAVDLWSRMLDLGGDLGVVPAGLGARDSLRAEAGFPLYGHELAGDHDILPVEAGYGAFVKEHKPFFVGREPHLERARRSQRRIARLEFEHAGIRMFHPGDPVVNQRGVVVGTITSTILPGDRQLALALVDANAARPGNRLAAILRPRRAAKNGHKPVSELNLGDTVAVPEPALVLDRFPKACGDDDACIVGG